MAKNNNIEFVNKSRKEQEAEFKQYVAPYANPACFVCLGRGWTGWHIYLKQLIPCGCAMTNIKAEYMKGEDTKDSKGFLTGIRSAFGQN